jgi:hypothetical protein
MHIYHGYILLQRWDYFPTKSASLATLFTFLRETRYVGRVALLPWSVGALRAHCVWARRVRETAYSECIIQRGQKHWRMLHRDCREDEGEHSTQFLQSSPLCADWCAVWLCHAGGGRDSSSCLDELFEFVVVTSLMPAHIDLNWLWCVSPRIPLIRCLHCPEDPIHDFSRRSLHLVLRGDDRWCHSTDCDKKSSAFVTALEKFCTRFLQALLCSTVSIFSTHLVQTFL